MSLNQQKALADLVENGCDHAQAEAIIRTVDESRDDHVAMDDLRTMIREELEPIREEQAAIREEQTVIREEQTAIREEQTAIREEQTAIREAQAAIHTEVEGLRNEQTEFRGDMNTRFAEFKGEAKHGADVRFEKFAGDMNTQFVEFENRVWFSSWRTIGGIITAVVAIVTIIMALFAWLT